MKSGGKDFVRRGQEKKEVGGENQEKVPGWRVLSARDVGQTEQVQGSDRYKCLSPQVTCGLDQPLKGTESFWRSQSMKERHLDIRKDSYKNIQRDTLEKGGESIMCDEPVYMVPCKVWCISLFPLIYNVV